MMDQHLRASLISAYNKQADLRNKSTIETWKATERAAFLSMLQRENVQTLLEIGAGHGRDSLFFKEQGFHVTCIDLSPAMVKLCRKKSLTALVMDIVDLGFEKNSFEAVYALNSFLHIPKSEFPGALENVHTVLQPAGLFFLGMYGGFDFEGIWEEDAYVPKRFFSFYTDTDLKERLSNIFEIVSFRTIEFNKGRRPFQSVTLRKRTG